MAGLFSKGQGLKGGKYLVQRRDGTVPPWPWFVLGAADPQASATLRFYADQAEKAGRDASYVADIRELADDYEAWLQGHGEGDPDAPRHRVDDPAVIEKMIHGRGA